MENLKFDEHIAKFCSKPVLKLNELNTLEGRVLKSRIPESNA